MFLPKNILRKRKSVLFINPDYYHTFFIRDELKKLGWSADIFVVSNFPNRYLYDITSIIKLPKFNRFKQYAGFLDLFWFVLLSWRYRIHFYYGRPPLSTNSRSLSKFFPRLRPWNPFLVIAKIYRARVVYLPSGCRDEFTREEFSKFDQGNVCKNCAYFEQCDEASNRLNLEVIRKYSHLNVGQGFIESPFIQLTPMRWKSLDLDLWKPDLHIPADFLLPSTSAIRIYHSGATGPRHSPTKNIKGTHIISEVIDRLKREGHNVELISVKDVHISNVRFWQAQADIVIDQLFYGHWGSTALEGLALGKPTICYLRDDWKQRFFSNFPEFSDLPIIEANEFSIYRILEELVLSEEIRNNFSEKSRRFAESFLNPQKNAREVEFQISTI